MKEKKKRYERAEKLRQGKEKGRKSEEKGKQNEGWKMKGKAK